jgi:hypothetical protein
MYINVDILRIIFMYIHGMIGNGIINCGYRSKLGTPISRWLMTTYYVMDIILVAQ